MAEKSKILVIGGTGNIGKFIVEASAKEGHLTFVLVRKSTTEHPEKAKLLQKFEALGATLVTGDIHDNESLVKAIKQVDVVISAVGTTSIAEQIKLIAAIKEAGNVKRFLPSEFYCDVDHVNAIEPAKSVFKEKADIRRAIEAAGIAYTYVACNGFAGYLLPILGKKDVYTPPQEKITILGDGNQKVVFVKEEDIAMYTIKAIDDPRTLNTTLIFRPPSNVISFNEIISIWESKIGKTLEKTYVSEDQLIKNIQEAPFESSVVLSLMHSAFVKGDTTNFEIEPSFGMEACALYPELKCTTIDEYLTQFA